MSKLEFKPNHFISKRNWKDMEYEQILDGVASRAQEVFDKWLEENGVRVWGKAMPDGEVWDWQDDKCQVGGDTHQALLVCVEEIAPSRAPGAGEEQ